MSVFESLPATRVEDYKGVQIEFRYVLSRQEELELSDIIHTILYGVGTDGKTSIPTKFISSAKSKEYATEQCSKRVPGLVKALDSKFETLNSQSRFFMRLSTLSPKDAYRVLIHNEFYGQYGNPNFEREEVGDGDRNIEDEMVTIEDIEQELGILCVSGTNECT